MEDTIERKCAQQNTGKNAWILEYREPAWEIMCGCVCAGDEQPKPSLAHPVYQTVYI